MRAFGKARRGVTVAAILSIGVTGGWGISSALGGTSKRREQPAYNGPSVQPLKSTKNAGKVNWVEVEYNGTKLNSYPTSITTTRFFTGEYEVVETKDVAGCGYVATPSELALVEVEPREGNPDAVFVVITNPQYELENVTFYLAIIC